MDPIEDKHVEMDALVKRLRALGTGIGYEAASAITALRAKMEEETADRIRAEAPTDAAHIDKEPPR